MTLPHAIEPDQLRSASIVVLLLLALVVILALRFVRRMVTRVVVAGALIGAGLFVYAQRDDVKECQDRVRARMVAKDPNVECRCDFAGVKVRVPDCPVPREPFGF